MRISRITCVLTSAVFFLAGAWLLKIPRFTRANQSTSNAQHSYLGFDLNLYPGDAALPVLRKTFSFSGYWLNAPPGSKTNTWLGKREALRKEGFGFLVLFNGRETRELKTKAIATQKGIADSQAAIAAAKREGFSTGTVIFVDIEEGGRLSPNYHAYLQSWSAELNKGGYKFGAYCSGIPVKEGPRVTITTADDIRSDKQTQDAVIFAYNDACPPSPGCTFPKNPPLPSASGVAFANVWQFAQSPKRREFAAHCPPGYHPDGNCYAPGDTSHQWFLDISTSASEDPSGGAK